MKKCIALLLACAMLTACALMLGCEGAEEAKESTALPTDIMNALTEKLPDVPAQKNLYINGVTEDDDGYLDPEYACYLYTGAYEAFPTLDKVESYAIRLPDGKSVYEIHIFKVKDAADVAEIQDICNKRIEQLQASDVKLYDAEAYEKVIKTAEVYTEGNYVYLLCTTDNELAKTTIQEAMYPADAA